jgi:hypothetical protein
MPYFMRLYSYIHIIIVDDCDLIKVKYLHQVISTDWAIVNLD